METFDVVKNVRLTFATNGHLNALSGLLSVTKVT